MSDLAAFEAETRAWLEENAPISLRNLPDIEEHACWGGRRWIFHSDDQRLWLERMSEHGWTVPEWPKQYGGAGMSRKEARILQREMARIGIRRPLDSLGIWMLGPALLRYGSDEQKQAHLPKIARGEIRWAQGFSEPGAGSDLAGLSTRCEDAGDHYRVNGSKLWTSYGDKCDWIFTLVRSEPDATKHLGISLLLIDMDSPGVSTRPIRLITGESHFTATFFDDVRVPKDNLVGEPGRGWDIAKFMLLHEREMIGSFSANSRGEESVAALALQNFGQQGLRRQGQLRSEVIRHEIEVWAVKIAMERTIALARAAQADATSASVLKVAGTELKRKRTELLLAIEGDEGHRADADASLAWLHVPGTTIAGGSNEIQLNIIAKRALQLPST